MIRPRKEYFQRKRAAFVATWNTDSNGVVHIPLKGDFEALISESKKEIAAKFGWFLKKNKKKYYVEAKTPEELREIFGRTTSLHRVVSNAPKELQVDHVNGNGLDCTDSNLRWATMSQNTSNRKYKNKTGYRGVVENRCSFNAQIDYGGKNHYLGSFSTAKEAAKRYNEEAIKIFGEFSILNEFEDDYEGDLVDLSFCDAYDTTGTVVA